MPKSKLSSVRSVNLRRTIPKALARLHLASARIQVAQRQGALQWPNNLLDPILDFNMQSAADSVEAVAELLESRAVHNARAKLAPEGISDDPS